MLSALPSAAAALVALTLAPSVVNGQTTALASKRFDYNNLPYRVDTDNGERGFQTGYNRCNATTEGQASLCQTAIINSVDDWCFWAPQEPNSVVGDVEGNMVAWCTKPGHGTRVIPAGAITGVQFTRTPHYVQVVGFFNQQAVNIQAGDYGGEMDPHGADQRGNPLGGLLFSTAFANSSTQVGSYQQVIQWHNFMGGDVFCLKACDPSWAEGYRTCEHIYDRIGCKYNAPNAAQNGVFETCLGDDQLPPGIYVENGQTRTYTQPPESLGVISSIPYEPAIPASSSCTPFESAALFAGAVSVPAASGASSAISSAATSGVSAASSVVSSGASAASSALAPGASAASSVAASGASAVGSAASAAASATRPTGGAGQVGASMGLMAIVAVVMGVVA